MINEYRIIVKINNAVHETHDITRATWGNNTRDIAASTIRDISNRLIMANGEFYATPFSRELIYLDSKNEQKETKENQRFDCC